MEKQFPKNVRQIGNVCDSPKIYVEDYVDTFLNQLCDKMEEEPKGAFLIGEKGRIEEQDCVYISGAVRISEIVKNQNQITLMENGRRGRDEGLQGVFRQPVISRLVSD